MKFVFRNDNESDSCIVIYKKEIIIIQGKFFPRKGRIVKIDDFVNDLEQLDFDKNITIDIVDFKMANSTGIMKIKKILKAIIKEGAVIKLIVEKGNRFHEITIKTLIESIHNVKKVKLCS